MVPSVALLRGTSQCMLQVHLIHIVQDGITEGCFSERKRSEAQGGGQWAVCTECC